MKIKKNMIKIALPLFVLAAFSCAGGAGARSNASFSDVKGRDWVLTEVKSGSNTVTITRTNITGEIYTIRFEDDRLSGMAAPNRYFGPYTSGEGHSLSMGSVANTLMAALFENEDLKEYDYFTYLGKVTRWELRKDGKLELYTSAENGSQVILIYS